MCSQIILIQFSETYSTFSSYCSLIKEELEANCPGIMKLGLLHELDTTKIHLEGQPSFVSFEHKSLQELAAAMYICHVLEYGDDIQVSALLVIGHRCL